MLWNPKDYYRLYNTPPPVPILSKINPDHALYPSSQRSILLFSIYAWFFQVISFPQIPPRSPCIHLFSPAHFLLLDWITRLIIGEEYRSCSASLCTLLDSPITSFFVCPNILLTTLFSNILSLRFPSNLRDLFSQP